MKDCRSKRRTSRAKLCAHRQLYPAGVGLGRSIVNTHPLSGRLRTWSLPPFTSTPRRLIPRPSPTPDRSQLRCSNSRNKSSGFPFGRPPHSSSTSIKTRSGRRKRPQQNPAPGSCELETVLEQIRQCTCKNLAIDVYCNPGSTSKTTSSIRAALASPIAANRASSTNSETRTSFTALWNAGSQANVNRALELQRSCMP